MSTNKQNKIPDEVLYSGKIPPQHKELELNVLGGMIINNNLIDLVGAIIQPKHFYVTAHQVIFTAILRLKDKATVIDLLTLTEELKSTGQLDTVGGPYVLSEISTAYSSEETISYSANKILEAWIKRDMILLCYSTSEACFDQTVTTIELLDKHQAEFTQTIAAINRRDYVPIKKEIIDTMQYVDELQNQQSKGIHVIGVPSGYQELDEITGGFQKAELIIVAGRPSHGKTAIALNFARNASLQYNKKIGIFSIEMSARELAMRFICLDSKTDLMKLKTGRTKEADWQRITDNMVKYMKLDDTIWIDDTAPLSLLELKSKARRMKTQNNIDMVIVDYIGLMEAVSGGRNMDRHLEIAVITRGLKALSKELDIPVMALSQLSRKVEERGGKEKRPMLSDLRESGAIEQDADVVLFINRPEIYMKKNDRSLDEYRGLAEIIVAKQRNGPIGDAKLTFKHEYAAFYPWSNEPIKEPF